MMHDNNMAIGSLMRYFQPTARVLSPSLLSDEISVYTFHIKYGKRSSFYSSHTHTLNTLVMCEGTHFSEHHNNNNKWVHSISLFRQTSAYCAINERSIGHIICNDPFRA